MDTVQQLEQRRRAILEQMAAIRAMRRGTVSQQYLKVRHQGRAAPAWCGPYYVLTRKQGGKTISQRVPAAQVEQARAEVASYRRFVDLCQQFAQVTERLGQLERTGGGPGQEKKRRS